MTRPHKPLHFRASLQPDWSHVDRAIDPPELLPFVDPEPSAKPATVQNITTENLGEAWARLEKLFEPVVVFLQRFNRGYLAERERLS